MVDGTGDGVVDGTGDGTVMVLVDTHKVGGGGRRWSHTVGRWHIPPPLDGIPMLLDLVGILGGYVFCNLTTI